MKCLRFLTMINNLGFVHFWAGVLESSALEVTIITIKITHVCDFKSLSYKENLDETLPVLQNPTSGI